MAGKGVSVTISAVDQASSKIDQINKRLAAAQAQVKKLESERSKEEGKAGSQVLTKGFEGLKRGIAGVPDGLGKIQRGFGSVASRARDAFHAVGQIVTPLSAITSAASIAGLTRLATSWAHTTQQLGFAADRAGMAVGDFKAFQDAARLMGMSGDQAGAALTSLKDTITNAFGGRDPEAVGYLQQLGIKMEDLKDKSPIKALEMIERGMVNIQDPTLRARIQASLFKDSSAQLMHVLLQGPGALEAYMQKARQHAGLTKEQRQRADELEEAQTAFKRALRVWAALFQPNFRRCWRRSCVISPSGSTRTKELIAQDLKKTVVGIKDALKEYGPTIKWIIDLLGGWKAVLIELSVFMGTVWLAKMLAPIFSIARSVAALKQSAACGARARPGVPGEAGAGAPGGKPTNMGARMGVQGRFAGCSVGAFEQPNPIPSRICRLARRSGTACRKRSSGNTRTRRCASARKARRPRTEPLEPDDREAEEPPQPGETAFWQRHAPTWAGGRHPNRRRRRAARTQPGGQGTPAPAAAPGAQGLPAPANDQGATAPAAGATGSLSGALGISSEQYDAFRASISKIESGGRVRHHGRLEWSFRRQISVGPGGNRRYRQAARRGRADPRAVP